MAPIEGFYDEVSKIPGMKVTKFRSLIRVEINPIATGHACAGTKTLDLSEIAKKHDVYGIGEPDHIDYKNLSTKNKHESKKDR